MTSAGITVDYEGWGTFSTDSGHRFGIHSDYEFGVIEESVLEGISAETLVSGLEGAQEEDRFGGHELLFYPSQAVEPLNQYTPPLSRDWFFEMTEEAIVVRYLARYPDPRPEFVEMLESLLLPLAESLGSTVDVTDEPEATGYADGPILISAALPKPSASGHQIIETGNSLEAIANALGSGEFSAESISALIEGGFAQLLVGMPENEWFDAKSAPYKLEDLRGKLELSKDIAAFANARTGGVIVMGAATESTGSGDVVKRVKPIPKSQFDPARYRAVVRERILPELIGLRIEFVAIEGDPERGYAYAFIPPQPVEAKPFVVHGALIDEEVIATAVWIPVRAGEDTQFKTPGSVHSLLQAGMLGFSRLSGS